MQQNGYVWSEVEADKMASEGGKYTMTKVVDEFMEDPSKLHEEMAEQLKVPIVMRIVMPIMVDK